ncbi:MAG: hypothetical protein H0U57_05465 [Tatlockia sp.]|nr:hypothetical protein [Tatlockia sp.]
MSNIGAIRWLTRGKYKLPLIQYMLINSQFEYLIPPKEVEVVDIEQSLSDIILEMKHFSASSSDLKIRYKSVIVSYGRHRKDSGRFHFRIRHILWLNNLHISNNRTSFLLKKEDLKRFKNALYFLDIDCKSRGNAFVTHLWAIALKATRAQYASVIKKIWKTRMGLKTMNKHNSQRFKEFYSLL